MDIAKLENIKNIDANFTSHVEMEVVRPDASPYGFLGDGIGMISIVRGRSGFLML